MQVSKASEMNQWLLLKRKTQSSWLISATSLCSGSDEKKKKAVEMDIILDLSSQQVHMKEVLGLH